jgi:hypothetical protein
MDEHEKNEEQVEDLDTPESEAEEVKGGSLNFTNQAIKGEFSSKVGIKGEFGASKLGGSQDLGGAGPNHNETLVVI